MHEWHGVASTEEEAVEIAMRETTIDMSMVPLTSSFTTILLNLVKEGVISESRIDESVERILRLKDSLGLFDDPVPPIEDPLVSTVGQNADWDSSLNAARESIALLKNENNILPIKKGSKIFLTGPTADSLRSQTGW